MPDWLESRAIGGNKKIEIEILKLSHTATLTGKVQILQSDDADGVDAVVCGTIWRCVRHVHGFMQIIEAKDGDLGD